MHLIDLDQPLPGQRKFISCWVSIDENLTFIVDPGPTSTGKLLVQELKNLEIKRLDFILLTHIHLDHAGATADVLEEWPEARVVCHRRGRPHLVQPDRLWEGSKKVLQEVAEAYGKPRPVSETALADFQEAAAAGIEVIETPGHAPHHLCFLQAGRLFLGEAAGTFSTLDAGPDSEEFYLRPATPPMFKLEVAQASLAKLLALEPEPEALFFAHHGHFCGDSRKLLRTALNQLSVWVDACTEFLEAKTEIHSGSGQEAEIALIDHIAAELTKRDQHLARGAVLPSDIQAREKDFTRQSLWGMLGYVRARG